MIDAVIYGDTQIAIIAKFSRAHHISITKYPNPPAAHASSDESIIEDTSTKGTGIYINNLYIARIPNVKYIFFIIVLLEVISLTFLRNFFIRF